jgi:hypothetical protein
MQRRVIGEPKAGLALRIQQTPVSISLASRPDPLLLYVVIAAALAMGIIGGVAASPREGIVSFLAFTLLFSPLIVVLVFNALRIKTLCTFDKEAGVLRIDERSFTRRIQEIYPLDAVDSISVRRLPSAPLGGASSFGMFIGLQDSEYLAASSNDEAAVGQDAWRLSRFLGLPLELPRTEEASGRTRARVVLTAAIVYLVPIVIAISALVLLLDQMPGIEPSLAGLLSAVVISEIGAMLAFAYYRSRRPYEG